MMMAFLKMKAKSAWFLVCLALLPSALRPALSGATVPPEPTLEAQAGPGGLVRVLTNAPLQVGTEIRLEAVPNDLYAFWKWHDGNTANPRSVTLNSGPNRYTATFTNTVPIIERFEVAVTRFELLAPDNHTEHFSRRLSDGGMLYWTTHVGGIFAPSVTFRRLDNLGNVLWQQSAGNDVFAESSDHGLLFPNPTSLTFIDAGGARRWSTTISPPFDGADGLFGYFPNGGAVQGADGTVWAFGLMAGKPRLEKVSPTGALLWSRTANFPPGPMGAVGRADGSALFYGNVPSSHLTWAASFASDGEPVWQGTFPLIAQDVIAHGSGWLFGYTRGIAATNLHNADPGRGGTDIRILKIRADGSPARDASFGGAGADEFKRFKTNIFGEWFILGTSASDPGEAKRSAKARSGEGSWIVKADDDLRLLWDFTFPALALDIETEKNPQKRSAWLIVRRDGSITYTGQHDPQADLDSNSPLKLEVLRVSAEGRLISSGQANVSKAGFPKPATNAPPADTLLAICRGGFGDYLAALTPIPADGRITISTDAGNGQIVIQAASPGTYQLERKNSLGQAHWIAVGPSMFGSRFTNSVSGEAGFYRLRVP